MSSTEESSTKTKANRDAIQQNKQSSSSRVIDIDMQMIDDALSTLDSQSYGIDPIIRQYALENSIGTQRANFGRFPKLGDGISPNAIRRNLQSHRKTLAVEVDLSLTEENKRLRDENKNLRDKVLQLEDYVKSLSRSKKLNHIS